MADASLRRRALGRELAWLYALEPRGIRYELERVREALELVGRPDDGLPIVHVAGTNGKGSVSAMIERGLRAAGLRTGLFTSPHLHRFAERVRLCGRPLSDARVATGIGELRAILARAGAPPLTFFEVTFLLALRAFRAANVEVAVLETGIGGRLDATRATRDASVCVLTTIALDHLDLLGPTLLEVAREKAGILRAGVPLVCGVRDEAARAVVLDAAASLGAPVSLIDRDFDAEACGRGRATVRTDGRRMGPVHLALRGAHQRDNAAVAAAALASFSRRTGARIDDSAIARALSEVRWPGRLELVARRAGRPRVLLDAAHNPQGAAALRDHLASLSIAPARTALVFGCQATKDARAMLESLAPLALHRFFAAANVRHAVAPSELARLGHGLACESVEAALRAAIDAVGPSGLVVVAGSIFVMARARAELLGVRSDPALAL